MFGAMIGGFRRGELVELTWDDVDFEAGTIRIDESISLTEGGKAVIEDPKTKSSIATADMPKWYIDELKKYEHSWKKNYIQMRDKWKCNDGRRYVFHAGYGKLFYFSNPSQWWKKFLARHELKPIRLNDLRHTTATLLLKNDADLKKIQARLRHSQYATTADLYTHVQRRRVGRPQISSISLIRGRKLGKSYSPPILPQRKIKNKHSPTIDPSPLL